MLILSGGMRCSNVRSWLSGRFVHFPCQFHCPLPYQCRKQPYWQTILLNLEFWYYLKSAEREVPLLMKCELLMKHGIRCGLALFSTTCWHKIVLTYPKNLQTGLLAQDKSLFLMLCLAKLDILLSNASHRFASLSHEKPWITWCCVC